MGILDYFKKHKNKNIENDIGLNEIIGGCPRPGIFTTLPGIGTETLLRRFRRKGNLLENIFMQLLVEKMNI